LGRTSGIRTSLHAAGGVGICRLEKRAHVDLLSTDVVRIVADKLIVAQALTQEPLVMTTTQKDQR
jgi:hypothetical protein